MCDDQEANVRFEPCKHTVACSECCIKMKKCLKCGSVITKKVLGKSLTYSLHPLLSILVTTCHVNTCHHMSCEYLSLHVMRILVTTCHVNTCHYMSCQYVSLHVMSILVTTCHVNTSHCMSCEYLSLHVM